MKILYNEDLSKHTTIRIGGIARVMIVPENVNELLETVSKYSPQLYIGGGSNLLINNRKIELVVDLKYFNSSIENLGNGQFSVGASVRLQKLINLINKYGYGGIEYLCSVPGLVGGATVMNAGRGKEHNKCISDYVLSVKAIVNGELTTINKNECGFEYRSSIFKNSSYVIVSVLFNFPLMNMEESSKAKKERITLCKEKQDNSSPNFGSVFMECNPAIMSLVKKIKMGGKKVHFSGKTANWIVNKNNGSFSDALNTIRKVETLHKILRKKCKREVIVWE